LPTNDGILPNFAQDICSKGDMKTLPVIGESLPSCARQTLMARDDRSYEQPRLPQGVVIGTVLVAILAAGVYLIVSGLA
jgi:hypothetical protein